MRNLTAAILLLFGLLPACRGEAVIWIHGPADTELAAATSLSLHEGPLPVIDVTVDGATGRFLVDTGSQITVLDRNFAEGSGIRTRRISNRVSASTGAGAGEYVFERCAQVRSMTFGAGRARNLQPLVMELDHLQLGIDGILGMDILGSWILLFDADVAVLRLLLPNDLATSLAKHYSPGTRFTCWPLVEEASLPRITMHTSAGTEYSALIDTGAIFTAIPEAVADEINPASLGEFSTRRITGSANVPRRRIESFSMGETIFSDVDVDVCPPGGGRLGYGIMRRLVFAVDASSRQFCFVFRPDRVASIERAREK